MQIRELHSWFFFFLSLKAILFPSRLIEVQIPRKSPAKCLKYKTLSWDLRRAAEWMDFMTSKCLTWSPMWVISSKVAVYKLDSDGGVLDSCHLKRDHHTGSMDMTWPFRRNADSPAPPQTYWIRICIVSTSPLIHVHINIWEAIA